MIELKLMIIVHAAVVPAICVIFFYDLFLDGLPSDRIGLYVFEGKHSSGFTVVVSTVVAKLAFIVIFEIHLLFQVERLLYRLFYYFVLALRQQIFHIQTVSLRITIRYVILVIVEPLLTLQRFYKGDQFREKFGFICAKLFLYLLLITFHYVETLEHASCYFIVIIFVEMYDLMVFIFPAIEASLERVAMNDAYVVGKCSQRGFFVFGKAVCTRGKIESFLSCFHYEWQ
jgi:hypothetical protein